MVNRTFWHITKQPHDGAYDGTEVEQAKGPWAQLISSKLRDGQHAPALDLDIPHHYLESRTKGHGHLYIDVPMPWWRYRVLLWWLYKVRIIERGYYKASVKKRQTNLVNPLHVKSPVDQVLARMQQKDQERRYRVLPRDF